ncbi:MAG: hypothetical protein RLZZ453_243 [Chlamydiota bacterium]|jgi:uncharacterized protein with beta-barrel porin domain
MSKNIYKIIYFQVLALLLTVDLKIYGATPDIKNPSISPLRNVLSTVTAEHNILACSQILTNHIHQRRQETAVALHPVTVWGSAFGEYAHLKGKIEIPTSSIDTGGIVTGFDRTWEDSCFVGVALAYAFSSLHERKDAGKADVNQGAINIYGEIICGKWYVDLSAFGGYYASANVRHIVLPGVDENARATIHGWQLAPHFEVGYEGFLSKGMHSGWRGIEPFFLGDWIVDWEAGFQEKGAGIYDMGQKRRFCSLVRGEIGLRLEQAVIFNAGHLCFTEKGSYACHKPLNIGRITTFFVGSSDEFVLKAFRGVQSLGIVELSISFLPKAKHIPNVELSCQAGFGSRYHMYQGSIDIFKSF